MPRRIIEIRSGHSSRGPLRLWRVNTLNRTSRAHAGRAQSCNCMLVDGSRSAIAIVGVAIRRMEWPKPSKARDASLAGIEQRFHKLCVLADFVSNLNKLRVCPVLDAFAFCSIDRLRP